MADEQPTQTPQTSQPATGGNDVEQNKVFAILAYFGILFLVPLLAAKDSKFAQYHANQGLSLFLTGVVIGFVWVIPFLGWVVGFFGWIFVVVLFVMGIINAANGKMKPLPVIGGWQLLK